MFERISDHFVHLLYLPGINRNPNTAGGTDDREVELDPDYFRSDATRIAIIERLQTLKMHRRVAQH